MRELFVPLVIILMLGSILFPVPPWLLNLLLVINLLSALQLLASALFVSEPTKLSALPSMLLLLTLFRLVLNISTTRLILGHADAGEVVAAFGSVVMQGQVAVGLVIFLVLSLVQFIVVAKGAERVAEVAARFTLDALPGKQMSIDADLRAGLLSADSAKLKREELQTESRFYGALDGAMKFVKGDAIAGLIIVGVNLVGGLALGLSSRGMGLSEAVNTYTTLTIGDGLLAQIPSLLNAVAAGLIVTRVVTAERSSLAKDLWIQGSGLPLVRGFAGLCALLIAMLPGFPSLPFAATGLFLLGSVLFAQSSNRAIVLNPPAQAAAIIPLVELLCQAPNSECVELIELSVERVRQELFSRLGILLPTIATRFEEFPEARLSVLVRGVQVAHTSDIIQQANLERFVFETLAEYRTDLFDDALTQRLLDLFDPLIPELISTVVPNVATVTQITELLRALTQERIPIRNFDLILQAIAEHAPRTNNEKQLLEEVRISLKLLISSAHADEAGEIRGVTLGPALDIIFARAEREKQSFDVRCLDRIVEGVSALGGQRAVLVTSRAARRLVRECLNIRGIAIPVLGVDEISAPFKFNSLGQISHSTFDESLESLTKALA